MFYFSVREKSSKNQSTSPTEVPQPSTSQHQQGQGIDPDFVAKVASLVSSKLFNLKAQDVLEKLFEKPNAAPIHAQVLTSNVEPPVKFDCQKVQNDMNSAFNEKVLLQTVPVKYQREATALLSAFDERANDITWDSSGIVYIDETSIPQSNIYKIFPKLFKKGDPKRLPGYNEVRSKLKQMGLNHLIHATDTKPFSKKMSEENLIGEGEPSKVKMQWWYIGE